MSRQANPQHVAEESGKSDSKPGAWFIWVVVWSFRIGFYGVAILFALYAVSALLLYVGLGQ